MSLFGKIFVNFIVVLLGAYFMPRVHVDSIWAAVVTAVIISILNGFVKPILKFLAFPITFLTLGLFLLVINGIMILLADFIVPGFYVEGLIPAIIFSIILSFTTWLFDRDSKKK